MSSSQISVVIPAYNAASYIVDSITSVLKQSFTDWELIVVDDGSTDNTSEIVNTFLTDQRIKLISQINKGVSAARNAGIAAATGRYIAFLDADDAFLPDNLKTKYEALNANPLIGYVYSDIILSDPGLKDVSIEEGIPGDKVRNAILNWDAKSIPGFSSNVMVRTDTIKDRNIYFDIHLSNCADRYYKILLASECEGFYIPKPLIKYRNTPDSMSKKVFLLEHDELYILDRIKEKNIIPASMGRNKLFAKVYLMLSGSWYRDGGETLKAFKFALKAFIKYPFVFYYLIRKSGRLLKDILVFKFHDTP